MTKLESLPDYGNFVPVILSVILNNMSLIGVQNLPGWKMQIASSGVERTLQKIAMLKFVPNLEIHLD